MMTEEEGDGEEDPAARRARSADGDGGEEESGVSLMEEGIFVQETGGR